MAFGGDLFGGSALDALLAKLGADSDELEEAEDPPDRVGSGPEIKRVPLSGLGSDWFCPVVSLVKRGQVPKAKVIALKSYDDEGEESMDEERKRLLTALVRTALGRPEGDDLAALESYLEGLEPTVGQEAQAPAAAMKSFHGGERAPDRDQLGRRLDKPYAPRTAGRY